MIALREMRETKHIYSPKVINSVTILTFNILDFTDVTKDASAANVCKTLNKFEETLHSRLAVYPAFFKV